MITHFATIQHTPEDLFEKLTEIAQKFGFPPKREGPDFAIRAPLGDIVLRQEGRETRVSLTTKTAPEMQLFKELYAQRLVSAGVAPEQIAWDHSGAVQPLNQMQGVVTASQRISPGFQRIRLEGDFGLFLQQGAGLHFRFLLHPEGADWPRLDARGLIEWPGGGHAAWHRPVFTVRAIAEEAAWIDVDIALPPAGRASTWAQAVAPGTEMALQGPSGGALEPAAWMGLIGDETAMPVIARQLEAAPRDARGAAILLLRHPEDAQEIAAPPGVALRFESMGCDPLSLLPEITPPADVQDRHLFFAGERRQATAMRAAFKAAGVRAKCASYWTA